LIKYFEYTDQDYKYEPFTVPFMDGSTYKPDFLVGGLIYEVKNSASLTSVRIKQSNLQLEFGIQSILVTKEVLKFWFQART
jgi:hypothetical protein